MRETIMAILTSAYPKFGRLSLSAPVHPHSIAHIADMCAGQPVMVGINALAIPLSKMGGDGCDNSGNVIQFPEVAHA